MGKMKTERTVVAATLFAAIGTGLFAAAAPETSRIPDFTWENSNPGVYKVSNVPIRGLTAGRRAQVTMWVDASELSEGGVPEASLAWDDRNGKTWIGGSGGTVKRWNDKSIEKDALGRRRFVVRTPIMPGNAVKPKLYFFAKRPAVGKIRYTDIELTIYPRDYDMWLGCSAYHGESVEGIVRFAANYVTDIDAEPVDSLRGTFFYVNASGKKVRVAPARMTDNEACVEIDTKSFAPGEQTVRFELAKADGTKLAEASLPFTRLAKPPSYRVMFDSAQRTLVDGRPFFPLGMYWSENTLGKTNALERYAAAGVFNCLQTYEKAMTPEILDRYWEKGLRVMASVKDIYLPEPDGTKVAFCPPQIKTKEQETAYVTEVVNRCKDHPALLAWYTCDEMRSVYAPRLIERYRLLKRLDPQHPVFVLAFPEATRAFFSAYDATGTDPYPVANGRAVASRLFLPGEGAVWKAGEQAEIVKSRMCGLKPLWQVPQAFKWQWDHKELWEDRFPTRRELASMTWQQIAAGANAIFFYSYGQMLNGCKGESELMEYFDETTVPVAREVKRLVPVLLLDPGPELVSAPAKTRVRTWTDGRSTFVLVCNTHPEKRTGEVVLPGTWAKSETLLGGGATLQGDRLVLDMKPIDSVLIRLDGTAAARP